MKKIKKFNLIFATMSFAILPATLAVSCKHTDTSYSYFDQSLLDKINSPESENKLEEMWMKKVLTSFYVKNKNEKINLEVFKENPLAFRDDFQKYFIWYIANQLISNKKYLSSYFSKVVESDKTADERVIKAAKEIMKDKDILNIQTLNSYLSKLNDVNYLAKIFFDVIKNKEGKILYSPEVMPIKKIILKSLVTMKYLSINEEEWKTTFPTKYNRLSKDIKDISKYLIQDNAKYYPLIIETLRNKWGFEWSISLSKDKSFSYLSSEFNKNHTMAEADNYLKENSPIITSVNERYSILQSKAPSNHADITAHEDLIGYQGIKRISGSDGNLKVSKVALEENGTTRRDGYLQDGKIVTKDIRFLNDQLEIKLNKVVMIMPLYDSTTSTLTFKNIFQGPTEEENIRKAMYVTVSNESSLFNTARDYFVKKENPILLEIKNREIGQIWKDKGIKYIKIIGD